MCWLHASDEGTCILAFHFCVLGLLALVSITPTTEYTVGTVPHHADKEFRFLRPRFAAAAANQKDTQTSP